MERLVVSESFLNFCENCSSELANRIFRYYFPDEVGDDSFLHTGEINYLTFRNDGTISFLPKGKEHQVNEDGSWKREGRQNGKPSKIIRKAINPDYLDSVKATEFESFSNCYNANFSTSGYNFILKENNEVHNVYNERLESTKGTLGSSCMNGDDYFEIYECCKFLKILTLYNEHEELAGRALIWYLDECTIMDRIYTTKDFLIDLFIEYANDKNWWHKKEQSYDNKTEFVKPDGEVVDKIFKIYTNTNCESYPYIDTFTYGEDGMLTNNHQLTSYTYNNTDGTRNGDKCTVYDEIDECNIDEDDAVRIERGRYRDCYTHVDNSLRCYHGYYWWFDDEDLVYVDGDYYDIDSCHIGHCEIDEKYCLKEDLAYIEIGEYKGSFINNKYSTITEDTLPVWKDDPELITTEDGRLYHLDSMDDVIEYNGLYYSKWSNDIVEIDGEYKHVDELKQEEVDK